jgi:hypothetical protein
MTEEQINTLKVLSQKEDLLSQLIVWLKAKGLLEQAGEDIPILGRIIRNSRQGDLK